MLRSTEWEKLYSRPKCKSFRKPEESRGITPLNWGSNAGIMERYLAVALGLEDAEIITDIQLEHKSYDIKVVKPEWSERSLFKKMREKILGY